MNKVVLVSALVLAYLAQDASAQLSESVQNHLTDLANSEITRQLVNGSDAKSANQSVQNQDSMLKIV